MLIDSPRLTTRDREAWARNERVDAVNARRLDLAGMALAATQEIRAFWDDAGNAARGYCGVSWGKDSVVVADLIARAALSIPLVWIRVDPVENPDCVLVRDAFLAMHPRVAYGEIAVAFSRDDVEHSASRVSRGAFTSARGFAIAAERYGNRHVSGVRAAESAGRRLRMRVHGPSTDRTCAPIGWWSTSAVFAYLHARGLPVHPAYAMTMGGALDRERLRVASLGGARGAGFGRREWERRYYPERMRTIEG